MTNSLPRRVAALAGMALLTGCAGAISEPAPAACPPWPIAGPAVAAELETLSGEDYPALWGWIDRLAVLQMQLGACEGDRG
ncbi:hypothetical protein [Azospirillum sp. A39]|uniref:hypothetical protein n=1 Tax=Azospirillum sp. A39 TaxID=3462279 RepID=UPI0040455AA3